MSEQEQRTALIESIREFKNSIYGLSLEVEGWRRHASTNGDFVLITLRDILVKLNTVLDKVNDELRK